MIKHVICLTAGHDISVMTRTISNLLRNIAAVPPPCIYIRIHTSALTEPEEKVEEGFAVISM